MRDISLSAIIMALIPICILRPWIGILVWYWFGLMNPHKLTWGFARDMPWAIMIGGALLFGLLIAKDRRPIPKSPEITLMLAFLVFCVFTTMFAWAPEFAWQELDKVAKIILMTIVATMLIYGKDRIYALLLVIGFSIGFYGVKGGIFTILTGGANRVQGPESTFIGGNTFLGLALVMVFPLLIVLARMEDRLWLKRALLWTGWFCALSAVFTYSRGALLGLAVVLPLLFLKTNKKFLVLVAVVPIILFGKDLLPDKLVNRAETIETYQEDNSAMQRIRAWNVAWHIALDRPLTGAGFEFEYSPNEQRWFSYMDPKYLQYGPKTHSAHSIYFQVLGQHGFIGLGLFLALLITGVFRLWKLSMQAKSVAGAEWIGHAATGLYIGTLGYMISGAFLNLAYFDLMYIYIALGAILMREFRAHQTAAASESVDDREERREPIGNLVSR